MTYLCPFDGGCSASSDTVSSTHNPVAATQAALPAKRQIAGLVDQWNAALATGDPQTVADLSKPCPWGAQPPPITTSYVDHPRALDVLTRSNNR
jgi:hypothetical protein